jgi:hypothetical protein
MFREDGWGRSPRRDPRASAARQADIFGSGLGVLPGAPAGSRVLIGARIRVLHVIFSIVAGIPGSEIDLQGPEGLLLLIATPVASVAVPLFAFARERDWIYVAVTAIVLGVLVSSVR